MDITPGQEPSAPRAVSSPIAPALSVDYDWRHGLSCALVSMLVGLTQGMGIFLVNNDLPAIQGRSERPLPRRVG